jgi:hypothetical protein
VGSPKPQLITLVTSLARHTSHVANIGTANGAIIGTFSGGQQSVTGA